jgi:hypothetical protein
LTPNSHIVDVAIVRACSRQVAVCEIAHAGITVCCRAVSSLAKFKGDGWGHTRDTKIAPADLKLLQPRGSEVETSRSVKLHVRKRLGGGVDTPAAASLRGRGAMSGSGV